MAQLSESLVREAIRRIRGRHMHHLTINEVEQALWAWLMLNGFESRPTQETCAGCIRKWPFNGDVHQHPISLEEMECTASNRSPEHG